MKLVVVIPTYNEAENLPKMVSALFQLPIPGLSILVVDDNSPDGTGQIADELKASTGKVEVLHRSGKLGLGTAYIAGFKRALELDADFVGQMDCDFSHPVEKVPELYQAALDGIDLALGSRYISGGSLDHDWPLWRKTLSGFGNFYARTILNLPIHDVTGGFKIWRGEFLKKMPLDEIRSNGYVFQVEMAYVALKMGCRYREIPFHFADRKWGQSKMSLKIQTEAAFRVWKLLSMHKQIKSS